MRTWPQSVGARRSRSPPIGVALMGVLDTLGPLLMTLSAGVRPHRGWHPENENNPPMTGILTKITPGGRANA